MAVFPLQTSNVFSYTFAGHLGQGVSYLQASNNNPIFNIGGRSWTIECWFKPVGLGYHWVGGASYGAIFSKRLGATATSSYFGYIQAESNRIGFYNGTEYVSQTTLSPNTWNHIAWVFNQGANVRIFVNGLNVMTTTAVTSVVNNEARFYIGKNDNENNQIVGDISNFRITLGQALYSGESFNVSTYPVQLPNNAIGPHAGGANVAASLTGNVIFLTCNDQIIKANGNTVIDGFTSVGLVTPHFVDTTELQNFSYYFPGNTVTQAQNSTVLVTNTTNSLNLNTDFTIETWFYPQTNTGVLLERGYAGIGNNNASYILIWDTPNNNINFAVANANNAAYSLGSLTGETGSLGAPVMNAWNHIAVTRTGNTYRGFLNGALTFTPGTNANTPYAALGRGLTIGGMFNSGQTYATGIPSNTISGFISNLRIIRGNSVYNAAFTPSTTRLPVVTNTILLTALTPTFQDLSGNHSIAANGQSEITFSPATPFLANSVINANATSSMTTNYGVGQELIKIYDTYNFVRFGQTKDIYAALAQELGRMYSKFNTPLFTVSAAHNIFTLGQDQSKITDKIDTAEMAFSMPVNVYTLGQDQGRIYNKLEVGKMAFSVPLTVYTLGQDQGRIYAKQLTGPNFAYIPVGGVGSGAEYQFWS